MFIFNTNNFTEYIPGYVLRYWQNTTCFINNDGTKWGTKSQEGLACLQKLQNENNFWE